MIERMVLFGASGDLTSRLLLPAVAQLAEAELLPPGLTMVGSDITDWSTDDIRQHIAGKLQAGRGKARLSPVSHGYDNLRRRSGHARRPSRRDADGDQRRAGPRPRPPAARREPSGGTSPPPTSS